MAANYRLITHLDCLGQSPRNDVKQYTILSLPRKNGESRDIG